MLRLSLSLAMVLSVLDVAFPQERTTEKQKTESKLPCERLLTGDDARRAEELDREIERLAGADDFPAALVIAEELVRLRVMVQGADHYQATDARHELSSLRIVAALDRIQRQEWQAALRAASEIPPLEAKAEYAKALDLHQRTVVWTGP